MTTIITKFQLPTGKPIPDDGMSLGPSAELVDFEPAPLRPSDVIGRRVDELSCNLGTYGMGGAGFFGLRLGEEWLVIAIWGADEWLQAEGRRVADWSYFALGSTKLWVSDGSPKPWISDEGDQLSPLLIGKTVTSIDVAQTTMRIAFDNDITLSIEEDPRSRPIYEGSKELRAFKLEDDLRNGVFLSPTREIWI